MVDQVEIHRLVQSKNVEERREALTQLHNNFAVLPNKNEALNDLIRLAHDEYNGVRLGAAFTLGADFIHIPDKKLGWEYLIQLTQDEDSDVQSRAADALSTAFSHLPDKKQACEDLHQLTHDQKSYVRSRATAALHSAFSHLPDKEQGWVDLHRLTQDEVNYVRGRAAYALGSAFSHIPDKKQGWIDLKRLIQDKDSYVKRVAIYALGSAFSHIPDKKQGWTDLKRLIQDKDSYVKRVAIHALGSAFSYLPDKKEAYQCLIDLTKDEDINIRVATHYSLGRASIFLAIETENEADFRKEVEKAIGFFEKSSNESTVSNPAKFCLPFYRSFYTITFKKEDAEAEVEQYLAEAKSAVSGSKSKEKLLEAVENLENALKEVQKARDIDAIKSDLNTYRRYCDRACELLDTTEEKAPGASSLIRKGLPIIDERIKQILAEIQGKAKALCKQVKDTEYKEIGQQVNNIGQELSKVKDMIALEKGLNNLLIPLSAMCKKIPEEDKSEACDLLKQINSEEYIENKLPLIGMFLSKVSTLMIQIKEQNMGNIEILNSKGVQVSIGKDNYQAQDSNSLNKKYLKKSLLDILDSSATVAAFIGFLAVEIGTYFYPLSYNHLISAVAAAISFIIVAMLNKR